MSIEKHTPSGSRLPGIPKPVNVMEIGGKGMPTELIIRNGKIYCYDENGQTTISAGIIQTAGIAARAIATQHLAVGASAFTHNITHYALNWYQIYFNSGSIYWANGRTITTSTGWLNAVAVTYLYANGEETLLYASTDPSVASGSGKTLIAIITPGAGWGKYATVEYQNGAGTTIDGSVITTGTVNAQKLNVNSIDASGYINATYINAGTLSVGGSGSISPSKLSFLDSANAEFGKVNTIGLIFLNSKGILLHNVDQTGNPAAFYNDSSNYAWLISGSANKIFFGDTDGVGRISMDLATKVIKCDGLGNYYVVGGTGVNGSVILKSAIQFWGTGFANISIPYSFGVTLSGTPLVFGMALGRVIPMNSYETGLDTAYSFATTSASADYEKISQQFTAPSTQYVNSVTALFSKTGTPAGTMVAEIYADSGGLPTGSALGTSTALTINTAVPGTYPGGFGMAGFTFASPFLLSASTVYHLVIRTIGFTKSAGVTELFWGGTAGGSHTGDAEQYNGSSWAAISPASVMYFRLFVENYSATQYALSTDFFAVLAEDATTTSINLQMAQLEITVNTFVVGCRYAALIGVFGDLP